MEAGEVRDAAELSAWLEDLLRFGTGQADAILLAAALRGGDAAELAATSRALAASRERFEEAEAQGAAFAATVSEITGLAIDPAPLPVAVGAAAHRLGLPPEAVIALYLQAFAGNLVSAAVRFLPLGQTEGQGVLAKLHGVIEDVAAGAVGASVEEIGTSAFGADLAAMRHETLDVRIFKT